MSEDLEEFAEWANDTIKDLQQKLLASQASEARMQEALEKLKRYTSASGNFNYYKITEIALATPANTAELEAYVESEIERRFEATGYWIATLNGKYPYIVNNMADVDDGYDANPLYAKKG